MFKEGQSVMVRLIKVECWKMANLDHLKSHRWHTDKSSRTCNAVAEFHESTKMTI